MNTSISSATEIALRKHIERAVRPVRAGKSKKLAMREELLGHLTAIYLEEIEQRRDEQAALAAAVERFGEPAALTKELDASIGVIDRIDYWEVVADKKMHAWFGAHSGQPWWRFGLRWMGGLALFNGFSIGLMLAVALLQSKHGDSTGLGTILKVFLLMTVTEPAAVLGIRGVCVALGDPRRGRRWLDAIVQAIGWSAFEAAVVILFWWALSALPTFTQAVGAIESFLIVLPPTLLFGGWLCQFTKRNQKKHDAWASLAIDE
jgi:hypothetical protein